MYLYLLIYPYDSSSRRNPVQPAGNNVATGFCGILDQVALRQGLFQHPVIRSQQDQRQAIDADGAKVIRKADAGIIRREAGGQPANFFQQQSQFPGVLP